MSATYVRRVNWDTILLKYLYCTYTVLTLYLHCTYTVLILYLYCTYTVLILYFYCTYTVLILYLYCTYTVLIFCCFSIPLGSRMGVQFWPPLQKVRERHVRISRIGLVFSYLTLPDLTWPYLPIKKHDFNPPSKLRLESTAIAKTTAGNLPFKWKNVRQLLPKIPWPGKKLS